MFNGFYCWVSISMVVEVHLQTGVGRLGARPHVTDPGLFGEPAVAVVVGDSGGDARPAGPGARGPGGGLDDALLAVKHLDLRLQSEC